jgi:hypothetical protein
VPGEHIDRLLGHSQQTVRGCHYFAPIYRPCGPRWRRSGLT